MNDYQSRLLNVARKLVDELEQTDCEGSTIVELVNELAELTHGGKKS